MHILLASTNPTKIAATQKAFAQYWRGVTVEGARIPSDVDEQPIGAETLQGARNRAENAKARGGADYYVGLEGGLIDVHGNWLFGAAACVLDGNGTSSIGTSSLFPLPESALERVLKREPLGQVLDEQFARRDIGKQEGAIGIYTAGVTNRDDLLHEALIAALIPHHQYR